MGSQGDRAGGGKEAEGPTMGTGKDGQGKGNSEGEGRRRETLRGRAGEGEPRGGGQGKEMAEGRGHEKKEKEQQSLANHVATTFSGTHYHYCSLWELAARTEIQGVILFFPGQQDPDVSSYWTRQS